MPDKNPYNYQVRPARLADLDAVHQLMVAQNLADYGKAGLTKEALEERWRSPNLNIATNTWVAKSTGESMAGYAELWEASEGLFHLSVYVGIDFRGQGIGTHLLQLAETSAINRSAGLMEITLGARISSRNPGAMHFLEKHGYAKMYSFDLMEIRFGEPPTIPGWPAGIHVRTFVPGLNEQATYQADEQASQDKRYHQPMSFNDWSQRMGLQKASFNPELWFLAWDGNKIAGVALNLYNPETHTGWIDHLGVRREWRRQGLGIALLLYSFAEFYRRGVTRVKLSVDSQSLTNAPRLYERAGMRTTQQSIFTRRR